MHEAGTKNKRLLAGAIEEAAFGWFTVKINTGLEKLDPNMVERVKC